MITIGRFKVSTHNFGNFRLDGGAMFGSVPKNLWSKRIQADQENCIPLSTRSIIIEDGSRVFLVDVGYGNKWSEKLRQIFAFQVAPYPLPHPSKVTDIILTHLHFDHAGGISRLNERGELELSYPNATVHLQKANFENAKTPHLKERASYLKENVEILLKAKLNLIDSATEIVPGIKVHRIDGHTVGQQWIEVTESGKSLFYPTDLIPTSHHLPLPYQMGYDMCAKTCMEEKERFISEALAKDALIVFQHDPHVAAGKIVKSPEGHFTVKEIVL